MLSLTYFGLKFVGHLLLFVQMETLVVVAQHRNQYYTGNEPHYLASFGSSPSSDFREINCRTFLSGSGILPTPLKASNTPAIKRTRSSPKPLPCAQSEGSKPHKKSSITTAIPINFEGSYRKMPFRDDLSFSELWAGPAYSNSPPPSSLPIPKFSLRDRRTISLDLPASASDFKIYPMAKSAPTSPVREHSSSSKDFAVTDDFATKDLRRILNLNIADD